ncbi:MAG: sugar ABC transporter permease [Anaerolineae bacterium]|nr:sugar ABC transporter permease [Anaerolineae bacterium]
MTDQLFQGEERLSSRHTRFAWTLLVPTLVVLTLVAARPLEQTFIKSLTDDEFGTAKPARYVGLDNYENLLSFRFAVVDCQKDDRDECDRTRNGSIIWELSDIEVEERETLTSLSSTERKKYTRYDVADTWALPGGEKGLRLLGKDPVFLNSIGNTLQFTFMSVTLEVILGLIIALVVNSSFKGRGLMRVAMLVPWAIPTVVSAVLWQTMMRGDQTGIFNKMLMDLGILSQSEQWFSTTGPWMTSIVAVDVWKTAPFMALLILAGLQIIPGDLYEAAAVDGASKLRQFFSITLPLLRPTIAVALIFRTLDALRAFDVFAVLLDTTRPSMASYNYNRLVLTRSDGYASAVGVMIFIFILLFTVIYVRFVGIERE